MDDLTKALATGFSVTQTSPNSFSTDKQHPRYDQFKLKTDANSQNARRKEFLARQKCKRVDAQKLARRIVEDNLSDLDEDQFLSNEETDESTSPKTTKGDGNGLENNNMDTNNYTLCSYSSKPRKSHKTPRLMLSEWLVDVPNDFESSCYIMPCPVGKRNIVTSTQGYTTASTKYGVPVQYEFPSMLPNGNRPNCSRYQKYAYTILDCVYCPVDNKYYCLDLLCWNGHPFLDCETEFRFYWLHTKFMEHPEITQRSRYNKSPFDVLPYFPCTKEGIISAVKHFPPEKLDGLWFFHKESHYHLGVTPLVGWLKPYMIPDMLQVELPQEYATAPVKKKTVPHKSDSSVTQMDISLNTKIESTEKQWAMLPSANDTERTPALLNGMEQKGETTVDFDQLLAEAQRAPIPSDDTTIRTDFSSDW